MKALTALLALAGAAGIGYLVYKKMNEQKEDVEAYVLIFYTAICAGASQIALMADANLKFATLH